MAIFILTVLLADYFPTTCMYRFFKKWKNMNNKVLFWKYKKSAIILWTFAARTEVSLV